MNSVNDLIKSLNNLISELNDNGKREAALFFSVRYDELLKLREKVLPETIKTLSTCMSISQYANFTEKEERLLVDVVNEAILSFSPDGKCTTLDDVRKQYPGVKLSDYPRGQSENEVTSYTSAPEVDGQVITFSFTVKNPDCLSKVIITAKE